MGGASTQIAFVPLKGTELKAGAFPVAFDGVEPVELYVHSFLGLGTTEAQASLQRFLAAPPAHDSSRAWGAAASPLQVVLSTRPMHGKSRRRIPGYVCIAWHGMAFCCRVHGTVG